MKEFLLRIPFECIIDNRYSSNPYKLSIDQEHTKEYAQLLEDIKLHNIECKEAMWGNKWTRILVFNDEEEIMRFKLIFGFGEYWLYSGEGERSEG